VTRRDYYQVLGVTRDASASAIRAAYARLMRLHHPDRSGELITRLADVQEAYRCLADRESRAAHDRMIAEADRTHAERQKRVQQRLRRYDRRHPQPPPRPHRRPRRLALAVIGLIAVAATARLLG
jgi:DnaJ-class molecular chaperone